MTGQLIIVLNMWMASKLSLSIDIGKERRNSRWHVSIRSVWALLYVCVSHMTEHTRVAL